MNAIEGATIESRDSQPRQPRKPARAELVGSLTRPPEQWEAMQKVFGSRELLGEFPQGQGSEADRRRLAEMTEAAVAELVRRQVDAGIDVVVDGEFSRWTWWMGLYGALEGFAMDREPVVARNDAGETRTMYVPRIDRKVRRVANPVADEVSMLARVTDRPFKVTLPAASRELGFWGRPVLGPEVYAAGAYEDPDQALADLNAVGRELLDEAVEAGAKYVQLDYPVYPHAADDAWAKVYRDGGVPRDDVIERALTMDNAMVDGLPDDVTTGMHFCRGNVGDKYGATGALDALAERVFTGLSYDVLLIEWSDPERHGGFEALRFVPPGMTVVLGIVDSKSRQIETEDELVAKIEDASRYLDISQLAVSPQCGFWPGLGGDDPEEIQWRKIDVMCRAADRVWGRE